MIEAYCVIHKRALFSILSFFVSVTSFAQTPPLTPALFQPVWKAEISQILSQSSTFPAGESRVELISRLFLGRPYLFFGPLGEGLSAEYDQDPLYRTDGFDCTTYLETILALNRSQNIEEFESKMNLIRYKNGIIHFTTRNHFTEIDWNPELQRTGILREVTHSILSTADHDFVRENFSKRAWYLSLGVQDLRIQDTRPEIRNQFALQLKQEGLAFSDVESELPIIKKSSLKKLKFTLPTPSVVNIVRVFQSQKMITHQVLAVRTAAGIVFRHASSSERNQKRVVEESFDAYIQSLESISSILGVNIQLVQN